MSIQGRRDHALGRDLFGRVFFHLAGRDVDIIDLRLPESRDRRAADCGEREKRNQEARQRRDSVQRSRSWVPGSNRAKVPHNFRVKFRTEFRPRALGRESRRPSRRAISTSFGRDSITGSPRAAVFLSNVCDNPESAAYSGQGVPIRQAPEPEARCYLVTIISFHG